MCPGAPWPWVQHRWAGWSVPEAASGEGRGAWRRDQAGQTRAALLTHWVPEQAASPHPSLSFPTCEVGQ